MLLFPLLAGIARWNRRARGRRRRSRRRRRRRRRKDFTRWVLHTFGANVFVMKTSKKKIFFLSMHKMCTSFPTNNALSMNFLLSSDGRNFC